MRVLRRDRGPLESAIEARCVALARRRGWLVRKMNGLGFRAWPDRLFLPPRESRAVRFWIEFKRPGGGLTPLQARALDDLAARGEVVHVISTFDDFAHLLEGEKHGH